MSDTSGALTADRKFFEALTRADTQPLTRLLVDDFVLVDVMSGSEVSKSDLLALVGSGQLKFESIDLIDARARRYGSAVVIVGHTEMRIRFEQNAGSASSRYTHVYVEQGGEWRLVSAQGTPISEPPGGAPR